MRALVQGVAAGYGIAVPVGPIAVLIVERGLRRGFRSSFAAGLGAAAADLTYATVAAIVGVAAAELLAPLGGALQLLAGVVLAGFAARGLWSLRAARREGVEVADAGPDDGRDTDDATPIRTFASLYGLTLLNPITVAYFAALVLGGGGAGGALSGRVLFVLGAFAASLSWQTLLAAVGALGGRHLPPRARFVTGLLGNVVILLLAARMLLS